MILTQCDGARLLQIIEAAAARLSESVDEVNALNVYPVPDGDTGTNMLHTMRSALAHARNAEPKLDAVAAAAAHGALMGARGNSGVILSQILRGMKEAFAGRDHVDGPMLAAAFAAARRLGYAAVAAPAPGTMLTALAAMSDAVDGCRGDAADVCLAHAVSEGAAAVERTRDENPVNHAAGVVDAGARGLWLLLDGALAEVEGRLEAMQAGALAGAGAPAALLGRSARATHGASLPVASGAARAPALSVSAHVTSWVGAYDVQFLITDASRSADELRGEMLEFGADCVLVVGDETAVRVHVHTLHPDQIVRIGMTAGRLSDVVVEDLDAMTAEHERATGIVVAPPARLALVAVVPGEGFVDIVRSAGATPLLGGATMNPSTQEILEAIRATGAAHVVVLPNDGNVILAAEQAAVLAPGETTVIPTRTVGHGIAALAAFDAAREPAIVIEAMREAAEGAHGIEVTRAIRASEVDGQKVAAGEMIALVDGRLVAHGGDELDVLANAAARLPSPDLLTLFIGSGVDAERAARARDRLRATCRGAEVEVLHGGQPHYPFLVAAE